MKTDCCSDCVATSPSGTSKAPVHLCPTRSKPPNAPGLGTQSLTDAVTAAKAAAAASAAASRKDAPALAAKARAVATAAASAALLAFGPSSGAGAGGSGGGGSSLGGGAKKSAAARASPQVGPGHEPCIRHRSSVTLSVCLQQVPDQIMKLRRVTHTCACAIVSTKKYDHYVPQCVPKYDHCIRIHEPARTQTTTCEPNILVSRSAHEAEWVKRGRVVVLLTITPTMWCQLVPGSTMP